MTKIRGRDLMVIAQDSLMDLTDVGIMAFGALQSRKRITPEQIAKIPALGTWLVKNPEWGKIIISVAGLVGLESFMPLKKGKRNLTRRIIKDLLYGVAFDGAITLVRKNVPDLPALGYSMQYGRPIDEQVAGLNARQNMMQNRMGKHNPDYMGYVKSGGVAPAQEQVAGVQLPVTMGAY